MITLAIANYGSLLKLTMPLGQLTVITGPNGSGYSISFGLPKPSNSAFSLDPEIKLCIGMR